MENTEKHIHIQNYFRINNNVIFVFLKSQMIIHLRFFMILNE